MQLFDSALTNYQKFKQQPQAPECIENQSIEYQIAYVYFKQKDYQKAATHFKTFVASGVEDPSKINDAYLRLGDSYFVTSTYQKAINAYSHSQKLNAKTADYTVFQTAISYGFLKNKTKKIHLLNQLVSNYPKSLYRDDAFYVLGTTYTSMNKNRQALESYDQLLREYPKSSFVPRVLLKKGLIFYNDNKNDKALAMYKEAVRRYPNTAIAQEAVRNARQIYVDTGRVDEYADWVKNLDFINVSNAELDNDMYESAEKQFVMNDYAKAISAFKKYLQNFPKGLHALQVHFYLAQSLESQHREGETFSHYQYVVEQQQNEFTEQALSKLSQLYLNDKKWDKAMPLLIRLEQVADHSQNILFAQSNLMKAYYNKENFEQAEVYAERVLAHSGIDTKIQSDAYVIIARSAIKTGNETKARTAYQKVSATASGELKAEALYYDAYFKHQDGNYKNSNKVVQKIASDYAAYKYWGAKGLIVMAKNFYELKDAYQATYILESVKKNFKQFDDVVQEATAELKRIKKG